MVTSYQGRPGSNLRNPAVRGMTSCMLHQISARANNSGRGNAISKTNLMNNFAKLVLDITDECSLTWLIILTHAASKHTEVSVIEI